jgi:hypothetical protein
VIGDGTDVELQLAIWGYFITGDVSQRDAILCETRRGQEWYDPPWDRRAHDVASTTITVGSRVRRAPMWFCLRWLPTELMERGIAAMHDDEIVP